MSAEGKLINGIDGWIFTKKEKEEAKKNCKLLMIDFELGPNCSLNCPFCFRNQDVRDEKLPVLDLDQTLDIIDQARDLGCKSIHIVGQGEPLEDRNFFPVVEYIYMQKMVPLIFTSGHIVGDDELANRYQNRTGEEIARELSKYNVSVIIKYNSSDAEKQDKIVGYPCERDKDHMLVKKNGKTVKYPYTYFRESGLNRLIEVGLNKTNPTKLGADILILKDNYMEILGLYDLFRKTNIYPLVVTFIPCGKTSKAYQRQKFDVTDEIKVKIWKDIYKYNIDNGIPYDDVSAFAGGHVCDQMAYGLYINNRGQVFECPGKDVHLGSLIGGDEAQKLKEIWACGNGSTDQLCPPRYDSFSLPRKLKKEIKEFIDNYHKEEIL